MIVPRYYEDLSVLHENTMPARAYYIPASRRMDKPGGAQGRVRPNAVIERNLEVPVF